MKTTAPGEGAAAGDADPTIPLAPPLPTDSIPQQLRRRREAARRLPPLDSGVRDPLDVLVSYSSEPLRLFWYELRDRGLLSDAITAELVRLARRAA